MCDRCGTPIDNKGLIAFTLCIVTLKVSIVEVKVGNVAVEVAIVTVLNQTLAYEIGGCTI